MENSHFAWTDLRGAGHHRCVTDLRRTQPLPIREGVQLEEVEVRLLRLDHQDVALEIRVVLILAEAVLEARVEQRAKDLVQHAQHAAVSHERPVVAVGTAHAIELPAHAVRERPERVVADHEVGPVLHGDVEVRRAAHSAVDVVDPFDPRRAIETRQRRRCLHRLRNRHRGILVVAEHHALGGVEVHRADVELALGALVERPEVVREPGACG
jgi:hypothetical protein